MPPSDAGDIVTQGSTPYYLRVPRPPSVGPSTAPRGSAGRTAHSGSADAQGGSGPARSRSRGRSGSPPHRRRPMGARMGRIVRSPLRRPIPAASAKGAGKGAAPPQPCRPAAPPEAAGKGAASGGPAGAGKNAGKAARFGKIRRHELARRLKQPMGPTERDPVGRRGRWADRCNVRRTLGTCVHRLQPRGHICSQRGECTYAMSSAQGRLVHALPGPGLHHPDAGAVQRYGDAARGGVLRLAAGVRGEFCLN